MRKLPPFRMIRNTVRLLTVCVIFVLFAFHANSQVTLFSEDFESASQGELSTVAFNGWKQYEFSGTATDWSITSGSCKISGTYSLTLHSNSSYCTYEETESANIVAYYATKINATNCTDLEIDFSWKGDGGISDGDYGTICYSTNGTTWNDFANTGTYAEETTVQNITALDISDCDGSEFYLGFRWQNNGSSGDDPGFIVDDIEIRGVSDCEHQIKLTDTYGDGWNNGYVDVYVNDVPVLLSKTLASGAGPVYYNFYADTGDDIDVDYTSGSFCTENYFYVYDGQSNLLGSMLGTCTDLLNMTGSCSSCVPPNLNAQANGSESETICEGSSVILTANPSGGSDCGGSWEYAWYTGTGAGNTYYNGSTWNNAANYSTSWSTVAGVSPSSTTTYKVKVRCTAETTCNGSDATGVTVTVNTESTAPSAATKSGDDGCAGTTVTLNQTGGVLGSPASWKWYSGSCGGTLAGTGVPLDVNPSSTTTYYVRAEGTCNTTSCASVTVTIDGTDMSYVSSTVTQNETDDVYAGTTNQEIIGIQVVTTGNCNPLDVTAFRIKAGLNPGTDDVSDIENLKIWYTGTSSTFATTTQYGSTYATPLAETSNMDIYSSQTLAEGTNYFWITYDIKSGATPGNVVDARCTIVAINGTDYEVPTTTDPAGSRTILCSPCTPTYSYSCITYSRYYIDDFYTENAITDISNLNTGCNGEPENYKYYSDITAVVTTGSSSFDVNVMGDGVYSTGYRIWIDFNEDCDFNDAGEDVWSGGAGTGLYSGSIDVPDGTTPGIKRMRVRSRNGSVPPSTYSCTNMSYGETEDYNIEVACGLPTLDAKANGSDSESICPGGSVTLTSNQSGGSGCDGDWEYAWFTGDGTGSTYYDGTDWDNAENYNTSWSTVAGVSPSSTTTYKVKVQCDLETYCNYEDETGVTVTIYSSPTADAGSDPSGCVNGSDPAVGGSPTASGGSGSGYTYDWTGTGSAYLSSTTAANPTFDLDAAGAGSYNLSVQVTDGNGCESSVDGPITVTVNSLPADPGNPTSDSPQCEDVGVTLTRSGSPPGGETWYWQGTSCGTNTGLGSGATYNATSSDTYYIRSQNTTSGCWSSGCGSAAITINASPANPSNQAATPSTICQGSSTDLTASVTGCTIYWYTSSCGGTLVGTGSPLNVSPTTTTTYYAKAYNTTSGCWSLGCGSVTVTVAKTTYTVGPAQDYATIQAALDAVYTDWSTDAFNCGDITVDIYTSTYTESVTPNTNLNPQSGNRLVIQAHSGQSPVINAGGETYGIYINGLDYVTVSGLTVHSATSDNIRVTGSTNCEIEYNKCYSSSGGDGISIRSTSTGADVHNNLCYSNYTDGVSIYSSGSCSINHNTCYGNGHTGSTTVDFLECEMFSSGSLPSGWSSTGMWAVDASPATPGYYSASYSLNYNDGVDYDNGSANSGTVTTSAIDITDAISADLKFYYQLQTEGTASYDWVMIEILRASDQAVLQTVGGDGVSIADASSWTLYTVNCNSTVLAETSIKVRFTFSADDATSNTYFGWFIDDVILTGEVPGTEAVGSALNIDGGTSQVVTNNIFYAKTGGDYYATYVNGDLLSSSSGYNDQYSTGSKLCHYNGTDKDNITVWNSAQPGNNDISDDPDFVTDGSDFHLQTVNTGGHSQGSWPPSASCSYNGSGSADANLSPAINAGTGSYSNEPEPNGGIVNMGCYGNTCQASYSGTSCIAPTVDAKAEGADSYIACEGAGSITLSANSTGGSNCSGSWEYGWYTGSGGAGTWWNGTNFSGNEAYNTGWEDPGSISSPSSSTTYTIKVRCTDDSYCVRTDAVPVTVQKTTYSVGSSQEYATIGAALDALYSDYGSGAFSCGDVTVDVYDGTYTESVTPNTNLNPQSGNTLIIQAHSGESPVINASGETYGVYINGIDYVTVSGFAIHSATSDNIRISGSTNCEISYNKCYSSSAGDGISVQSTSTGAGIHHNLCYSNYGDGISIYSTSNCTITNNTSYDNGHEGGQSTVFTEDFETGAQWTYGTLIDGDNDWVVTDEGCGISGNYALEIFNGDSMFYCEYNPKDNSDKIAYKQISTEGYTNLEMDYKWKAYGEYSSGEYWDYGKVVYSLDGSSWTNITDEYNQGQSSTQTVTDMALPYAMEDKATVYLGFRWINDNNTGTNPAFVVDDIVITGEGGATSSVSALYIDGGTGHVVKNNILYAKSGGDYYATNVNGNLMSSSSGFNNQYSDGSNLCHYNGEDKATLSAWNASAWASSNNDVSDDPLFVNAGTDFHIMSDIGSYHGGDWPPTTASGGAWSADASPSPSLDEGDPGDSYSNEPESNGDRLNQGCYGNTAQASKSNNSDNDSEAEDPASQIAANTIASTVDTYAEAQEVFRFTITDKGTSDGVATKVTQITVKPGDNNGADWSDHIQGIRLYDDDGSDWITTGTATISDSKIKIPVPSGNMDVPNGESRTYTLYIYLNTDNIVEGEILDFRIDYNDHDFIATASQSGFASVFGSADIEGNNQTITVTATELQFAENEPPAMVIVGEDFNVTVNATDENGNIDVDHNGQVTLVDYAPGTGNLSSASGLSKYLTNNGLAGGTATGTYSWTDVEYDTQEYFRIQAQSASLTNGMSDTIIATIPVDFDFDSDNENFSSTSADWEWGVPAVAGLTTDHSGSGYCWGTDLDDNYDQGAQIMLNSVPFEAVGTNVNITYYEWYKTESQSGYQDYLYPQYSINDGQWMDIITGYCGNGSSWSQRDFDVTTSVGDKVEFRWFLKATDTIDVNDDTDLGWYVDDITVTGAEIFIPDCPEYVFPQDGATVSSMANLEWLYNDDSDDYDVYFGTSSSPPFVTTTTSAWYNPTLTNNQTYYWKVVGSNVSGGSSSCETWSFSTGSIYNMQDGSAVTCGGDFYDSGGSAANYGDSENYEYTFTSDNGDNLQFTFYSFYTTANDTLYIYDGTSDTDPLLVSLSGSYTYYPRVTSTGTSIHFKFVSDAATNTTGWHAGFRCVTTCQDNTIAGDGCDGSSSICNLDGYCGNTSGLYTIDMPGNMCNSCTVFGGAIHNNSWLSFTASATSVTIQVTVTNCTDAKGIQVGIYEADECDNFVLKSDIYYTHGVIGMEQAVPANKTTEITAYDLTIGETYYVMIDGCGGDVCDYTVTSDEGFLVPEAGDDEGICWGGSVQLNASGGTSYSWTPTTGLSDPNIANPVASPTTTTTYTVDIGSEECPAQDEIVVYVYNEDEDFGEWLGDTDIDWDNCANWGKGLVPEDTSDVLIPTTSTYWPTKTGNLTVGTDCNSITMQGASELTVTGNLGISTGKSFTISSNALVTVGGHWTNSGGTFDDGSGTVTLSGSTEQDITSDGDEFYNMVFNNTSSAGFSLQDVVTITNQATFTDGIINTGSDSLVIDNNNGNAIVAGTGNSTWGNCHVSGKLTRAIQTGTDYDFPVGIGTNPRLAQITDNTISGVTYLTASHVEASPAGGTNISVDENGVELNTLCDDGYWIVDATGTMSGKYGIKLYFNGFSELSGADDNKFSIVKRPTGSASAAAWSNGGGDYSDPDGDGRLYSDGYAYKWDLSSFCEMMIGKGSSPLPVELLYFTANCFDDVVNLEWSTASEYNSSHWIIEKSIDGSQYVPFATVSASGNSNSTLVYYLIDEEPFYNHTYYQLSQTDFDGKTELLDYVSVDCRLKAITPLNFSVYPNPANNEDEIYVNFEGLDPGKEILVVVKDVLGNMLYSKVVFSDSQGNALEAVDPYNRLTPGIYLIIGTTKDEIYSKKFIIR